MLTTSDADLAARARRLREHGMNVSAAERHRSRQPVIESYLEVGFNYRMTDIQAAVGLVQLDKLDEMVRTRRRLARRYQAMLSDVPGLRTVRDPAWGESNFQSFWVELDRRYPLSRNELLSELADVGVSARAGIMAAHRQPAYADHPPRIELPTTERLTDNTLILPLFHAMSEDDQDAVVEPIRRAGGLGSRLSTRPSPRAESRA
jgi:dTDP-4-amino-4,6-dideoxygalactose transaminase